MSDFGKRVPWQTGDESQPAERVTLSKEDESQLAEQVPLTAKQGSKVRRVEAGTSGCASAVRKGNSRRKEAESYAAEMVSNGTECDSSIGYVVVRVGECA